MRLFSLIVPLVLSATCVLGDENWTRFLGPRGDGHTDSVGLPVTWSEGQNIVWKTPIHDKGWSSPVIFGDTIWMTTATEDGKRLYGVCVDKQTGKLLHDIKLFDVAEPGYAPDLNSYASPTPVIEEGRVYLHFGSYGTVCLNSQTGEKLWVRDDLPCNHHRGPGSSPILFENLLILTFDGFDQQYLTALDKQTGKTVWRTDRGFSYRIDNGDIKKAYSTPKVIEVNGRTLLISPSAQATCAYDPRSGEEVWRVNHGGMNAANVPVYGHGMLFINTGAGGWKLFAMKPDGEGDVTNSHVVWKFSRSVPSRPSQLLVGDLLFMVANNGVASCVEAKTADVVWSRRLGEDFSASPLSAEGRIYFFSQAGTTTVVEASRDYKVLGANKLDSGCMASPAVSGKALYLRTKTHLYRVEKQP